MSATTVNVSFQKDLLADIDKVAKSEARTRSELLREAARMYIERRRRWSRIFSYGRILTERRRLKEADILNEIAAYRRKKAASQ
jgi:metal-responsive CopG/Arc/MetJ family transcriptional regulator